MADLVNDCTYFWQQTSYGLLEAENILRYHRTNKGPWSVGFGKVEAKDDSLHRTTMLTLTS